MSSEEDQIAEEELKKRSWEEINKAHKKRKKEMDRRIKAPTRWQKLNKQIFHKDVTSKFSKESRNKPVDPKQYRNGKLFPSLFGFDLIPMVVRGHIIRLFCLCPFDRRPCLIVLDYANCMACSRNTDEFMEGGRSR